MVSADVYRPAAIKQLETLAGEVGADFFPSTAEQKPVDIARAAVEHARLVEESLHRERKLGLGSATLAGFRHAIDQQYDLVLNLDADFSHPPEIAPRLAELVVDGKCDMAIGSRYVPGGRTVDWPWQRRVLSRWAGELADRV